jgi:hypothetical protein
MVGKSTVLQAYKPTQIFTQSALSNNYTGQQWPVKPTRNMMTQDQVTKVTEAFQALQQACYEAKAPFNCTILGIRDNNHILFISTSLVCEKASDGAPKIFLQVSNNIKSKPVIVETVQKP